MYFALPARTSAVQIDGRVARAVKRLFGDLAPAVYLAVPGYLKVNEADGKRLPGFQTPWSDCRGPRRWGGRICQALHDGADRHRHHRPGTDERRAPSATTSPSALTGGPKDRHQDPRLLDCHPLELHALDVPAVAEALLQEKNIVAA
jgi:hypothetical protein